MKCFIALKLRHLFNFNLLFYRLKIIDKLYLLINLFNYLSTPNYDSLSHAAV